MTSYHFFKMAANGPVVNLLPDSDLVTAPDLRCISICMLNFDEISQSTAGIKLLPVSENGRQPYWNSISVSILA